jgi:hypothetical protein
MSRRVVDANVSCLWSQHWMPTLNPVFVDVQKAAAVIVKEYRVVVEWETTSPLLRVSYDSYCQLNLLANGNEGLHAQPNAFSMRTGTSALVIFCAFMYICINEYWYK